MNADDQKSITDLARQLEAMGAAAKDPEADTLIQQQISAQPDAIYKLTQLVLIQHIAIDQLKAQLNAKSEQSVQPKGFLDDLKEKLFGAPSPAVPKPVPTPASAASTQPLAGSTGTVASSSFLRQAMTVGAGVAGGMMLGNALGSLLNHNDAAAAPISNEPDSYYNAADDQNQNLPADTANDDYQDSAYTQDYADNNQDSNDFGSSDDSGSDW